MNISLKICYTVVPSKSDQSKKRSASDAGFSSGVPGVTTKRPQRPQQDFLKQTGIYAGEKLSDSYSISHALNLLVRGKLQNAYMLFKQLMRPIRRHSLDILD